MRLVITPSTANDHGPDSVSSSTAALAFHHLFRSALARQVEYSFSDVPDRVTTMIPLCGDGVLAEVAELAVALPFAGDWSWSVRRFVKAVRPDAFLLRLDWEGPDANAVTLYCRFPAEPDDAAFFGTLAHARPFAWLGPAPSAMAAALGVSGPRGIALRVGHDESLHAALYFKSEQHVGTAWGERLATLLSACGFAPDLARSIEADLRPLYRPGPFGVVGVDSGDGRGNGGTARTLKFDPANVPLATALSFVAGKGVSAARVAALQAVAHGLRADSASYVGVQYGTSGFVGWRLYFACEPPYARLPGLPTLASQRHLRAMRRGPHY